MGPIADHLMTTLMKRAPEPPFWFTRLTDRWLVSKLSPEVDTLVGEVGMSSRQVERLAKRIYGAPPKLLARKYRALKAAAELYKDSRPWWDIAGDAFSDQSHFIRELRQFVGVTPTRLLGVGGEPPLVMSMSLERRWMLEGLPPLTKIT
jgi:methylphosphotriester-DNA--protein-cysteine methyltransferase